ncbi:MAG: twin-arginine translocase TatA/TatE family subunit [Bacteroidota bacterium]|nr:twin-arginine translocase TatA/TatE family subunit [Candidatus Kapabacteria bacterium]MDW8220865.1 twin-arginine translocase TatA/TatE family subunit [Bacteroidota bacterium]
MFGLGTPEILVIAFLVILLFGYNKIPELMKGLGTGIKEFKKAAAATHDEDKEQKSSS